MTPYMAFLLQPLSETLRGFKDSIDDTELWLSVIQTLTKSFVHDEGGKFSGIDLGPSTHQLSAAFWREDKLRLLMAPLMAQLPLCLNSTQPELRDSLRECLIALLDVMNDPSSLKSVNLELLMHTRSEDARVRLYALSCSEALWRAQGGKLIGELRVPSSLVRS